MENRICQSCSMPIEDENQLGTNMDGSKNNDYCVYCYKEGKFVDDVDLDEYIEMNVAFAEQADMTKEQMREHCKKVFPTLKRWQK